MAAVVVTGQASWEGVLVFSEMVSHATRTEGPIWLVDSGSWGTFVRTLRWEHEGVKEGLHESWDEILVRRLGYLT